MHISVQLLCSRKWFWLQHCINIKHTLIAWSACQFSFDISIHSDFRFPIPSKILKFFVIRPTLYLMRALFLHFYFAVFLPKLFTLLRNVMQCFHKVRCRTVKHVDRIIVSFSYYMLAFSI